MGDDTGIDRVWDDCKEAVNMTASEVDKWLDTDESEEVGPKDDDGESVGHASGRRIIKILSMK